MRKLIAAIVTMILIAFPFIIWPFASERLEEWDRRVEDARSFYLACPTVTGMVTASGTETDDDGYHLLSVRFTYWVEHKGYSGEQSWYLEHIPKSESAKEDQARYTRGKEVTVYYDPTKPENAVIAPMRLSHVDILSYGELAMPTIILAVVLGGCILIWMWACRRKQVRGFSVDASMTSIERKLKD